MAEYFAGKQLKSKSGLVSASEALQGKAVVLLYFSAHWCPPCRSFTPMLKECYETISKNGDSLAIIFVSSDRSEGDMEAYFNGDHGDWFAVPYGNQETINDLEKKCSVSGIPMLVVVNSKAEPVHKDARSDVQQGQSDAAYKKWLATSKN